MDLRRSHDRLVDFKPYDPGVCVLLVLVLALVFKTPKVDYVPQLRKTLKDMDPYGRESVAKGLKKVGPEAARQAGIK